MNGSMVQGSAFKVEKSPFGIHELTKVQQNNRIRQKIFKISRLRGSKRRPAVDPNVEK
jgi:hypothetical protein